MSKGIPGLPDSFFRQTWLFTKEMPFKTTLSYEKILIVDRRRESTIQRLNCLLCAGVSICSKQFLLSRKTNFEKHFKLQQTRILWYCHSIFMHHAVSSFEQLKLGNACHCNCTVWTYFTCLQHFVSKKKVDVCLQSQLHLLMLSKEKSLWHFKPKYWYCM